MGRIARAPGACKQCVQRKRKVSMPRVREAVYYLHASLPRYKQWASITTLSTDTDTASVIIAIHVVQGAWNEICNASGKFSNSGRSLGRQEMLSDKIRCRLAANVVDKRAHRRVALPRTT